MLLNDPPALEGLEELRELGEKWSLPRRKVPSEMHLAIRHDLIAILINTLRKALHFPLNSRETELSPYDTNNLSAFLLNRQLVKLPIPFLRSGRKLLFNQFRTREKQPPKESVSSQI